MSESCLLYGFIVSIVVSALKRVPFVSKHPKVVATVLSAAITVAGSFIGGVTFDSVATIVRCVAEQLAVSVAAYEVITKSVRDRLGLRPDAS